jgi:hypothetical protein
LLSESAEIAGLITGMSDAVSDQRNIYTPALKLASEGPYHLLVFHPPGTSLLTSATCQPDDVGRKSKRIQRAPFRRFRRNTSRSALGTPAKAKTIGSSSIPSFDEIISHASRSAEQHK